jgi:segregation and condensation protein A
MSDSFSVKTDTFEGPLDLLLTLIEERKMLISDISLSSVAESFLTYIQSQKAFPIADTAQFLVIASTLLLLKSRALLPVLSLTSEEEQDIHDLEKRLALLQVVRDHARTLATLKRRRFMSEGVTVTDPIFVPPKDMTLEALKIAAWSVIQNAPTFVKRTEVAVEAVVSLDQMIARLTERVQRAIRLSFKDFTNGSTNAREVVVGFLAMLELVKRGFANVEQTGHFEEITIEYAGGLSAPRYD